jgi:hypothetical protein
VRLRRGPATVTSAAAPGGRGQPELRPVAPPTRAWTPRGRSCSRPAMRLPLPLHRRRRSRRPAARARRQRRLARRRGRARPRREGHRQVDGRPCPRGAAAAGRRPRGLPLLLRSGRRRPRLPDAARHGAPSSRPARLVELPVGASEDRLVGSLDLERALTTGVSAYEPGPARGCPPRRPLRRRGQPPARPPRRPAARRRGAGPVLRRARGRLGAARRPLPARRDDEPGGGRAAARSCSTASASPSR